MCGGSCLKAEPAGHGKVSPVAFGAQVPLEFRVCGVWLAARDCSREAATEKSQICSEGLVIERKSQSVVKQLRWMQLWCLLVAAKPKANDCLMNLCPEMDAR